MPLLTSPNALNHQLPLPSGLRAWHKKNGLNYIQEEDPDIFAMMEIKCKEEQLPKDVKDFKGYHKYWLSGGGAENAKEGYAGIGLVVP